MSKVQNILFLFLMFLLIGCYSQKSRTKQSKYSYYFKEATNDVVQEKFKYLGYSVTIPNDWYLYTESHDLLWSSPKKLRKNQKEYYFHCKVHLCKQKQQFKDLESYFKNYIALKKKQYTKFDFKVVSEVHPIYGQYYLIIYKTNWNSTVYKHLDALYNYKDKSYCITYSALEKYFNIYLNGATQILESFKNIN